MANIDLLLNAPFFCQKPRFWVARLYLIITLAELGMQRVEQQISNHAHSRKRKKKALWALLKLVTVAAVTRYNAQAKVGFAVVVDAVSNRSSGGSEPSPEYC